jgi:hypothetical protein
MTAPERNIPALKILFSGRRRIRPHLLIMAPEFSGVGALSLGYGVRRLVAALHNEVRPATLNETPPSAVLKRGRQNFHGQNFATGIFFPLSGIVEMQAEQTLRLIAQPEETLCAYE